MDVFQKFVITICFALAAAALVRFSVYSTLPTRSNGLKISRRRGNFIFGILLVTYAAVFGTLSILRHESFHSGGYDLGIFDQVIWNSLQGRLFENSIMVDSPSFLGHHLSPILLALVPLYALWSDPRLLLIVQTVCLAVSALPVFWFARQQLGIVLAVGVSLTFLLYPALQYVNLFEFHEIALATPLLSFSIFFLLRCRYLPFLITLLLALLTKEEMAFVMIGMGVYLCFAHRQRALGAGLGFFGLAYAFVTFEYAIPHFFRDSYDENFFVMDRYRYLGKSLFEIIVTTMTQPSLVVQHLLVPTKIEFVFQLLVPLLFIPLVGGEVFALAIPTLGYLLFGDYGYQNSIHYQYTAPLIPFVFFALVVGLKRLSGWRGWNHSGIAGAHSRAQVFLWTFIFTASIANYFFQSAGPLALGFDPTRYRVDARVALGYDLLSQIPPTSRVMAEANLVPHLSERRFIYQAPKATDLRSIEYLIADTRFGPYQEYKSIWEDVLTSPFFETLADKEGYLLKKCKPYQPAQSFTRTFDRGISLMGYTIESQLPLGRAQNLTFVLLWRADENVRDRYVVFAHLVDAQDRIYAQDDREPANGWFRTDRWNTGDMIPDRYNLEIDETVPPGAYQIMIGLYNPTTGVRLKTVDGQDRILLAPINIP